MEIIGYYLEKNDNNDNLEIVKIRKKDQKIIVSYLDDKISNLQSYEARKAAELMKSVFQKKVLLSR